MNSIQKVTILTLFISLNILSAQAPALFKLDSGGWTLQGRKKSQEDRYVVDTQSGVFGVFDGHGGWEMADYAARHLVEFYEKAHGSDEEKLTSTYNLVEANAKLLYHSGTMTKSGTTALVAALKGNKLTLANTGDSRAMLFRKNNVSGAYESVLATQDHKPQGAELERIKKLGATTVHKIVDYIALAGTSLPICAVTRALGDIDTKEKRLGRNGYQILIPTPDIYSETIEVGDVLALASDGYWDMYDQLIKHNPRYQALLEAQITNADSALTKAQTMVNTVEKVEKDGAADNVTAIVVQFFPAEEEKQSNENNGKI